MNDMDRQTLKPLTNANQIAEAFVVLSQRLTEGAERLVRHVGWHGGGRDFEIHWHPHQHLWVALQTGNDRYLCFFGLNNPTVTNSFAPVCEMNFPHQGVNRRLSAAFVQDGNNRLYMTHSGGVGGGRHGIGKQAFRQFHQHGDRVRVQWPGGADWEFLIGSLQDDTIFVRAAHFVRMVDQFKQSITGNNS